MHTGGGFSGKGFKFDENEAAAVTERKKFQKAALGLQDSDDEDLEQDIDQQIESMFATKRTVKEIKAPLGKLDIHYCQLGNNWSYRNQPSSGSCRCPSFGKLKRISC